MTVGNFATVLHLILILTLLGNSLPPISIMLQPLIEDKLPQAQPAEPFSLYSAQTPNLLQSNSTCTNHPPKLKTFLPLIIKSLTGSSTSSVETVAPPEILPPDPLVVAPPLDRTVATDIYTATRFLYTGSNPIQLQVAPNAIEAKRVAVLRGRVLTRNGSPLVGVKVAILGQPKYGCTFSRTDGAFDLVVNGGSLLTVSYEKTGFLPTQRQLTPLWRDYAWLDEVVLIPYDNQV